MAFQLLFKSMFKYLGVIIANKLNFQENIHKTEKKIACGVGILSKVYGKYGK